MYSKADHREIKRVAPLDKIIYCSLNGKDEYLWLSSCRDFLQLNPKDRRDVVMKSGKCLNCLRDHFVKIARLVIIAVGAVMPVIKSTIFLYMITLLIPGIGRLKQVLNPQ